MTTENVFVGEEITEPIIISKVIKSTQKNTSLRNIKKRKFYTSLKEPNVNKVSVARTPEDIDIDFCNNIQKQFGLTTIVPPVAHPTVIQQPPYIDPLSTYEGCEKDISEHASKSTKYMPTDDTYIINKYPLIKDKETIKLLEKCAAFENIVIACNQLEAETVLDTLIEIL